MESIVLVLEFLFYFFMNDGKGDLDKQREKIGTKMPKSLFYVICMILMILFVLVISMIIFAITFLLKKV